MDDKILKILEKIDSKQDKHAESISELNVEMAKMIVSFDNHVKSNDCTSAQMAIARKNIEQLKEMVDKGFTEYNHQLSVHIKRTELLEKRTDLLSDTIEEVKEPVDYMNKGVKIARSALYILIGLATIASSIIAVVKYLI